jgi:hypothetical protein
MYRTIRGLYQRRTETPPSALECKHKASLGGTGQHETHKHVNTSGQTATLVATLSGVAVECSERHNTSKNGISGIYQAGTALVEVYEACRHLLGTCS